MNKKIKSSTTSLLFIFTIVLVAAGCNSKTIENQENNTNISSITSPVEQAIIYDGVENKNALQLLKENYQVKTKTFEGVGEFVQSINDKEPAANQFWAFYINGQSSQVGASQYQTKSSDRIEWKLEEIKQ